MTDTNATPSKSAPHNRATDGPFDDSEANAVRPYIDLGGIKILPREGLNLRLEVEEQSKRIVAVRGTRGLGKRDLVHNDALPAIEVDPQTYEVRADGRLLTCEPATVLPMAQRYFLF